jgi:hypothetical protein
MGIPDARDRVIGSRAPVNHRPLYSLEGGETGTETKREGVSADDGRLRLLRVPFTPEELVATVDRAIEELS